MYTVNLLHHQTYSHGVKTVQYLLEKNPYISGPMQFKLVLFKGQQYSIEKLNSSEWVNFACLWEQMHFFQECL